MSNATSTHSSSSELSRIVDLTAIRERRRFTAQVEATPAECLALAKRYEILSVGHVTADIVIKPVDADMFRLTYKIDAEIVQACGQTLVPVTQIIQEADEELLTTSAAALTPLDEATSLDDVPTDLIEGDRIDYGEIVAQIVALAIDPFPRADNAPTVVHIEHDTNPFAALQALKPGRKGQPAND